MNLVNYVKLAIIAAFLAGSASIYASGIEKLMQFTAPGTMGNLNKPAVIKDQQGGYLTGGSLILRGPQPKELQPLTVQTPRFAFDPCTGSADFRFGGLSFVSSKEFLNQLKSTVSAAGAYGLKMYLKTICPQCENVVMDLSLIHI
jgi:conjugative transfer pilus assembly protein TraH